MIRRDKTNYVIQSVAHSLDVLEQFAGEAEELGVTELSKRLKLHKNNVFRLLATLEARGYIEQNRASENYRLGIKCLQLGRHYIERMGLVKQARPLLEDIARRARETAFVAIARGDGVVAIEAAEPVDRMVRIAPPIGHVLPLHCTAMGKACLAFDTQEHLRMGLPEQLERFTPRTITERSALLEQLNCIASQGYSVDFGEYFEDVTSLAVPVRDYTRAVIGSLALAGPCYRISTDRIKQELAPLVLEVGRELSYRLGYNE